MRRFFLRPLLLSLVLTMLPSASTGFAQEDSVEDNTEENAEEAVEVDPFAEKNTEAARLLIGNFLQQSVQSIDISYLSPFETETITVVEHGYLPSSNGPAAYWLLELENISLDYLKPMSVLNYLGIRQETAEGLRSFVEMRSELYATPNAQWAPAPPDDLETLRMVPGAIWQIHLSTPAVDPFSEYALVNRLIDEEIHVGLPESTEEERLFHLMMADPTFSLDDYEATVADLKTELKELKQASLEQALADFDQDLLDPLEREPLDQAITENLTLIEHGVETKSDSMQTSAYWIFELGDGDDADTDEGLDDATENEDDTIYRYIAEDLWPFKGVQELAGMPSYDIPLEISIVVPTEGGLYMPLEQLTYQAAASDDWHGYLKVSLPITSPIHDHYLEYQGERFDIISDWGSSDFN